MRSDQQLTVVVLLLTRCWKDKENMGNLLGCSDSYDIDRQELENIIELKTNLEGKEKELEAELTKSAKKITGRIDS